MQYTHYYFVSSYRLEDKMTKTVFVLTDRCVEYEGGEKEYEISFPNDIAGIGNAFSKGTYKPRWIKKACLYLVLQTFGEKAARDLETLLKLTNKSAHCVADLRCPSLSYDYDLVLHNAQHFLSKLDNMLSKNDKLTDIICLYKSTYDKLESFGRERMDKEELTDEDDID